MTTPIANAVIWINQETKQVMVSDSYQRPPTSDWCDPIGAHYSDWETSDAHRLLLLLETAIDLAMQGYDLSKMLRAFATIPEFRALGAKSYPMCRALTKALVGKCLEPNTMTFEELLTAYA